MPRTAAAIAVATLTVISGCLGTGGGPQFLGDGALRLTVAESGDDARAREGSAICAGSDPRTVQTVSGDPIGEIDARSVWVVIDVVGLPGPTGAESRPNVTVGVNGVEPNEPGGILPAWQTTTRSEVQVTEGDALSGSLTFRDLEFGPVGESGIPDGLPEILSGTLSWSCEPLERVPVR